MRSQGGSEVIVGRDLVRSFQFRSRASSATGVQSRACGGRRLEEGERSIPTHAADNHVKGIHRLFVAGLALIAVATFLVSGQARRALADEQAGLGDKIAGTYLSVMADRSQVLQITRDGNLTFIFSIQFSSAGVLGSFSDTLGSWKKTGPREITAGTVDLTYQSGPGIFIGTAATTYIVKFDEKFQTGTVTCQGRVFPPGVDPFGLGAIPITNSEFTCGPGIEFHRIPIPGKNDK